VSYSLYCLLLERQSADAGEREREKKNDIIDPCADGRRDFDWETSASAHYYYAGRTSAQPEGHESATGATRAPNYAALYAASRHYWAMTPKSQHFLPLNKKSTGFDLYYFK